MKQYAVFLRGINVGGRIIKMADLRACLEKLGLTNVATLLQSGNVTFESDKTPAELKLLIESGLTETFYYPAKVQVYPAGKVRKIVDAYPFAMTDQEVQYYVVFLEDDLAQQLVAEAVDLDGSVEAVQAGDSVVYWRVVKGLTLKSRFATKYQAKAKYRSFSTTRNIKTLQKLLDRQTG